MSRSEGGGGEQEGCQQQDVDYLERLALESVSAAQLRVSPGNRVARETEPFWRK